MNNINLLPDEYIHRQRTRPKRFFNVLMAATLVCIIAFLSKVSIKRYYAFKAKVTEVNKVFAEEMMPLAELDQDLLITEGTLTARHLLYEEPSD